MGLGTDSSLQDGLGGGVEESPGQFLESSGCVTCFCILIAGRQTILLAFDLLEPVCLW